VPLAGDPDHDGWIDPLRLWLRTFDEVAPGAVEGLYVVGSAALGDWQPGQSDIDIVAVTAEPADEELSGTLRAAHAIYRERHPERTVDGPFVAWGDLTVPPAAISRPWMLGGAYRHDAECFEINPVTWFTLVRYGITVRGTELSELPIPTDLDERIRFVADNSLSYWRSVHRDLAGALHELADGATLPSSVAQWCVLGVCRMLYTVTTGDVISKSGAGRWAVTVLERDLAPTLESVVRMRSAPERPVSKADLADCEVVMADVLRRIGAHALR
jgi:hypothetical protein